MSKRTYLCECANDKCREEFTIEEKEYKRIVLSNNRIVLRGHTTAGEKILAMGDDILVVQGGTKWQQVKM